jgi:hypothetical protein
MSDEEYVREARAHVDGLRDLARKLMAEKGLSTVEAWLHVFKMADRDKFVEWLVEEFQNHPPDEETLRKLLEDREP